MLADGSRTMSNHPDTSDNSRVLHDKSKIFDFEPGRILSVSQAVYLYYPDRFMSLLRHERCIPFLSLFHGTPTDGPSGVHGEIIMSVKMQWPPLGTANGYRAAIDCVIPSP